MELIKEIPSLWKALSDDEKQVHTYNKSIQVFVVESISLLMAILSTTATHLGSNFITIVLHCSPQIKFKA